MMNSDAFSKQDTQKGDSLLSTVGGLKTEAMAQPRSELLTAAKQPQFNLDAIRLKPSYGESISVRRHITRLPVRKPLKTEFFRTRRDEDWQLNTVLLEVREDNEVFLFTRDAYDLLPELQKPATLYTAVDRNGNPFLIPVPLPGPDGRRNAWHQSLELVVVKAQEKWVRCVANMSAGGYDMLVAEAALTEPEWPDMTFEGMLAMAFRGKVIDGPDHPVVRKLKGSA